MIDDQDRALLAFIAEQRVVVEPQLAAMGGPEGWPRTQALAAGRFVRREAIFAGQPEAVWITAKGLGAIERRLSAPGRPDLRSYRHDVGVAWLWIAAQAGAFGEIELIRGERELRSHDRRAASGDAGGERLGVRMGVAGAGGAEQRHYPDLLLDLAGGRRVAIELELTPKGAARLRRIMRGFAFDGRIAAVAYLVPDRGMHRRVETAARQSGVGDLVHVQTLARDGIAGAGLPDFTAGRRAAPGAGRRPVREGPER